MKVEVKAKKPVWPLEMCLKAFLKYGKGQQVNGRGKRFKEIGKRCDGWHPRKVKRFINHSLDIEEVGT